MMSNFEIVAKTANATVAAFLVISATLVFKLRVVHPHSRIGRFSGSQLLSWIINLVYVCCALGVGLLASNAQSPFLVLAVKLCAALSTIALLMGLATALAPSGVSYRTSIPIALIVGWILIVNYNGYYSRPYQTIWGFATWKEVASWSGAIFHCLTLGVSGVCVAAFALSDAPHTRRSSFLGSALLLGMAYCLYAVVQWIVPIQSFEWSKEYPLESYGFLGGAIAKALAAIALVGIAYAMSTGAHDEKEAARWELSESKARASEMARQAAIQTTHEVTTKLEVALRDRENAATEREHTLKANEEALGQLEHEMHSPLLNLLLSTDRLVEHLEKANKVNRSFCHSHAKEVQSESARIQNVVQNAIDLLNWKVLDAELRKTEAAPVRVNVLCQGAAMRARARHSRRMHFKFDLAAGCTAFVRAADLEQIMTVMLNNAYEAMPTGGDHKCVVHITTRMSRSVNGAADGSPSVGQCVITVADNGSGIKPGFHEKLFARGETSKATGTGTGLYTARRLARKAGGDVVLADAPGGYSTAFVITLPTDQIVEPLVDAP